MKAPALRFNLPVGQWIDLDGKLLRFDRRGRDRERRLVFEGTDGVPADMTDAELLALQQEMPPRLRLLTSEEALDRMNDVGRARATVLDSAEDSDRARVRLEYVRGWERAGCPPRTEENLAPIAAGVHAARAASGLKTLEAKPPCARQVLRWIKHWVDSEGNIDALVPQGANGGNYEKRRDEKWHTLLETTVDEKYLVDTRPTAVSVHAHVIVAFADHNAALLKADHLPVPSTRAVYRYIDTLDRYALDCTRLGRRAADIKWRPKGSAPPTARHNEVWEVDHTTVDAIMVDGQSGLPIGRPTVTCIIDRHTRCIVGFHIGFDAAGTFPTLQCLRNAIQPKDALVASVPGVSGPWPCFGKPDVLIPDQGKEFKARSFVDGCFSIGIDVQYTPVLKPWYKGKIERFFKTLSQGVFHRVPGTTFANFFARNKENTPDRVAVVTLDELRGHVLRFIVDVYHKRFHRGIGARPLETWMASVGRHGMNLPPDPERVLAATSQSLFRVPQPYGIEFEGLLYNSTAVAAYCVRAGAPSSVRVVVDALDLTRIRFLDAETNDFVMVPIKRSMLERVRGVTLEKHKMARALQRANERELGGEVGLARAYTLIDRAMDAHGRQGGMANRKEAARYWEAIVRAREPEDAPAFDVARSASAITEGLYDEANPFDQTTADVPLAEEAAPPEGEAPGPEEAPVPPRKPRGRRSQAAPPPGAPDPDPGPGEDKPFGDDDLEAAARLLGMTVRVNNQ